MEKINFYNIVERVIEDEIRNAILNEGEKVQIMSDGVPVETYENTELATSDLAEYKRNNPDKKFTIRKVEYGENYIDKLDEMGEALDQNEGNMEEKKSCGLNENHKGIKITETQINNVMKNMMESSLPGLSTVEKVHKETDKETKEHMKDVDKKIKDHEDIEGNDNPEFPNQIGGEKVAEVNSDEEDEFVDDNRGGKATDLDYENDPGEAFEKRTEKYLKGDSTTGNSQDSPTAVKSDVGEKMIDDAKRKKKKDDEAPMYNKDEQPVNESVEDDINRVMRLVSYNKKTQ